MFDVYLVLNDILAKSDFQAYSVTEVAYRTTGNIETSRSLIRHKLNLVY